MCAHGAASEKRIAGTVYSTSLTTLYRVRTTRHAPVASVDIRPAHIAHDISPCAGYTLQPYNGRLSPDAHLHLLLNTAQQLRIRVDDASGMRVYLAALDRHAHVRRPPLPSAPCSRSSGARATIP